MTVEMICGYVLYYGGLLGFLGYCVFLHVFSNKISAYIFKRDLEMHGQIALALPLLGMHLLGFGMLFLVVIGLAIGRQAYYLMIFVAIAFACMGYFVLKASGQKLKLDGETIYLTKFRTKKQYQRSDICRIEWSKCRGITGNRLVIIFYDGMSYSFHMDYFQGLQNAYNELCDKNKDD